MALYVVPVPIGNLKDVTLRAIQVLEAVDFIITEDTRYSLKLLNHLGIKKSLVSYYRPREASKADTILDRLTGRDAALISDCGTPLISDPGYLLIKKAIDRGIPVIALPGPTAFVPALVMSGINPGSFVFLGFPPRKKNELESFLKRLATLEFTLVFYESPRRVEKFLAAAFSALGNRRFCVGKEISKRHEKAIRGELRDLNGVLESETLLGEMVIVIEGSPPGKKPEAAPEMNSQDDLFAYFRQRYGLPKNVVKKALMKK